MFQIYICNYGWVLAYSKSYKRKETLYQKNSLFGEASEATFLEDWLLHKVMK